MNISKERQLAIKQNEKYYFTGKPCKRGHISKRNVTDNKCLECGRIRRQQYRNKNKDIINDKAKKYRQDNLEAVRERERKYYHNNIERMHTSGLKWRSKNRNHAKKSAKKYYYENHEHCKRIRREYSKNNRGRLNALSARRYARKIEATPVWSNHDKIVKIYEECYKLTIDTGIQHDVDHIFPLLSKTVCGLHCEDNLQILTKTENMKKSNNYE